MILYQFPKTINIKDGNSVSLRPLRKGDEEILHEYFLRLPEEDRLCLRDDVTDPQVIKNWILDLNYDSNIPLIALDENMIVANGTLKFSTIGWTKHQGEIRITCDSDYREKGLATLLVKQLIEIARSLGLEQITIEIAPTLDQAYFLFEKLGFKEAAVFKDFIKDMQGNYEDMVLMIKNIQEPE
jgi:ribosomal protein S18 acetylase RimI-like enzyme